MKGKPKVAILMGSDSDWEKMSAAATRLDAFGIAYDVRVTSAHRTPRATASYVQKAPARGIRVFIVGAGAAAHLAGAVSAHTTLPVIGVPLDSSSLNGMDALLATVQMPRGVPVATVAIGASGAENAAILAAQILALSDAALARALVAFKRDMESRVLAANQKLQKALAGGKR